MPTNLVAPGLAVVAVLAAVAAVYYWRRASGLYALLVEGANRFEELRQRNSQLEQTVHKADERWRQQRETGSRLETTLDEARDQAVELAGRLDAKEHELRLVTDKLEMQKSHLERQLSKVEERCRLAEAAAIAAESAAEQRIAEAVESARLTIEANRQDLDLREREQVMRLRDAEKELAAVQKKVKDADPAEMRKLRRRIAQYDRLYNSMKGLREMTDERSRNYEVALAKLSSWVLRATGSGPAPLQLGPLVGSALQAIGAQLIDDSEAAAPRDGRVHVIPERGAARADSMADDDASHASAGMRHAAPDADAAPSDEALAAEEAALDAEHAATTASAPLAADSSPASATSTSET